MISKRKIGMFLDLMMLRKLLNLRPKNLMAILMRKESTMVLIKMKSYFR
jgi:hypothetical protein